MCQLRLVNPDTYNFIDENYYVIGHLELLGEGQSEYSNFFVLWRHKNELT